METSQLWTEIENARMNHQRRIRFKDENGADIDVNVDDKEWYPDIY